MTECNAIIEANKEIDKLKKENEKLNELCVKYGFEMRKLEEENEQLKQQLQKIRDNFEVSITQNREEFNKDKLYIKDTNTKLHLDDGNLFIEIYIPQIKEYYRFKYQVTGRNAMQEFVENYNLEVHND